MSQYFDVEEETLWNPSNGVARLFLGQAALFETELGLPSGIGVMENDECQIDPGVLEVFANAVLVWYRQGNHTVLTALSGGFVAALLVIAERAGCQVYGSFPDSGRSQVRRDIQGTEAGSTKSRSLTQLHDKVQELDRAMPR